MGGVKQRYGGLSTDCLRFDPSTLKVRVDPQRPEEPVIDEEMVWSILQHGVIEPLIISRDGTDLYVEAGRRRRAHAIEANRRNKGQEPILVPCVWARGDAADLAEKAIIENFHRQAPSAMGTAKAMQHLKDLGRDDERLRQLFGFKSINSVRGYLALHDCAPKVQAAVAAGTIAAALAPTFAKLPRAAQTAKLAEMVDKGATKGKAARKALEPGATAQKPVRMRSRALVQELRTELARDPAAHPEAVRVLDFVLGGDMATDIAALRNAAEVAIVAAS